MLKIVVDSSVYIAAITKRSFCYDLLARIFLDPTEFVVYISDEIRLEIEKTSAWMIAEQMLVPEDITAIMAFISNAAYKVDPTERIHAVHRDPSDNKILACAVASGADIIISLDKD